MKSKEREAARFWVKRTCDYDRVTREISQLIMHGADHGGTHRVVGDEEATVYRGRIVLHPPGYQRSEHEVTI